MTDRLNRNLKADMSDEEGLKVFVQSLSVRFEYHRSVEYHFKRRTKPPQCTSERSKTTRITPGGRLPEDGDVTQQLRSCKPRTSTTRAEADWDLIDLINGTSNAECGTHGVDQSHEVCGSAGCSGASGSVFRHADTAQKPKPVQNLCPACYRRYRAVRRHRAPIKDKLLDNDPTSLTCDQWLLIKKWLPRKPSDSSRGRGDALLFPPKREQRSGAGEHVTCSRPHAFLQRNLRRCTRLLAKRRGFPNIC